MAENAFEAEFLIRLAPVWLACRWKVMGRKLHGWPVASNLELDLMGMKDYGWEMEIIAARKLAELKAANGAGA